MAAFGINSSLCLKDDRTMTAALRQFKSRKDRKAGKRRQDNKTWTIIMRIKTLVLPLAAIAMTAGVTPASAKDDTLTRLIKFGGVCPECDMSGKDLSGANIRGASFPRSDFSNVDLSEARISGSNFSRVILKRANLSDAEISGSNFVRVDMTGAKLEDLQASGINFAYAILNGVSGDSASLRGANLSHAQFLGAVMPDADLGRSNMAYADISGANLTGASLHGSNLTNAQFDSAKLRDAEFDNANLMNARFGRAIVHDASFDQSNLSGADMTKAKGLRQSQLDNACGTSATKLPKGLHIQACSTTKWAKRDADENLNYTYNFDFSDEDKEALRAATLMAMQKSRGVIEEARQAIISALNEQGLDSLNIDGDVTINGEHNRFSWRGLNGLPEQHQARTLARTLRTLERLKLDNKEDQKSLDKIKSSLEKLSKKIDAKAKQKITKKQLAGAE